MKLANEFSRQMFILILLVIGCGVVIWISDNGGEGYKFFFNWAIWGVLVLAGLSIAGILIQRGHNG